MKGENVRGAKFMLYCDKNGKVIDIKTIDPKYKVVHKGKGKTPTNLIMNSLKNKKETEKGNATIIHAHGSPSCYWIFHHGRWWCICRG